MGDSTTWPRPAGPGHDLATTPWAINTLTINKRARKDAISDTYCLLTPRLHDLLGPGHDLATTPWAINTLTIGKRARKNAISDTYCLLTPRLHDLLGPGHDLATTPWAINTLTINKRARRDAISDTYCLLTPRLHDLLGQGHDLATTPWAINTLTIGKRARKDTISDTYCMLPIAVCGVFRVLLGSCRVLLPEIVPPFSTRDANYLISSTASIELQIVVCIFDTFDNNIAIKNDFTKYSKEMCW